jgi:hypothetical protein
MLKRALIEGESERSRVPKILIVLATRWYGENYHYFWHPASEF